MAFREQANVLTDRSVALGNMDRQDSQDQQDERLLHGLQSLEYKPLIIQDLGPQNQTPEFLDTLFLGFILFVLICETLR